MQKYRLLLLACILFQSVSAQNFGGNPPGKWAQVNTDTVRVIFPRGLDSVANRVASLAHFLQRDTAFNYRFRKINIVLQNNATISNAYVSLAPYRSEFYLMSPQNPFELGALNWADNLVVHEWRHVQQYNYFNRGLSRVASIFLGQEGRALVNALTIPDWFFEGDAVWNETKLSRQGRGRLPLSFSGYKSLFFEGKNYSYQKLRNGSYKDYVPNHYDLGYLLVAYGAEKYGKDFWSKVTADAASSKPLFYPLQGAIKKHTGLRFKQFVGDAFNFYEKQWKQEVEASDHTWLTKTKDYQVDYLYPYAAAQGSVVTLRQSKRDNPAFYMIAADGSEQRIAAQDITLDRYYSYKNGRIVYATYYSDARWTNREFSNIVMLDGSTGMKTKITARGKYFSPDVSSDGKKIVAVDMQPVGGSKLAMLDEQGLQTQLIEGAPGEVFSHPKFSKDDLSVFVMVRNRAGAMSLRRYQTNKEATSKTIVPFGNYVLGFPVVQGDTIVFTASNKTSDDVFAWVETTEKLYHLASSPTGLYQSTLVSGKLVASAFTASGQRLALVEAKWKEVAAPSMLGDLYVDQALDSKQRIDQVPTSRFAFKPYSKFSHPFNFHSWRPYYDPPVYSFTVYGQNTLNTIATELAYTYNENEDHHRASADIIYGGTFLQPFGGVSKTWNRSFAFTPDTVAHWDEWEYYLGLQLPLNLSGGKMFRALNLSTSYRSNDISFTGANKNLFKATDIRYLLSRASFSMQTQRAAQHIYPRFAFSAALQFRNALNVEANQFLLTSNLFLPGLLKTHNLVVNFAYQGRDTMRNYGFGNNFPFSRGYNGGVDFPRMWKVGGNYHFPVMQPEFGIGNIVYLLRLRANAFTDYTEVQSLRTGAVFSFHSVGGEVYFDTRWWNQLPVSFGVRYSRLMNGDLVGLAPNQWEFIVPVGLLPGR